jgi:hypothetical protein
MSEKAYQVVGNELKNEVELKVGDIFKLGRVPLLVKEIKVFYESSNESIDESASNSQTSQGSSEYSASSSEV